ncbi:hypothetical protein G6O69_16520 [Pseudenhygromyxa sp. WMMC2535]|uniref:HTTM domain-containing protein n=1 Tax=Pseudenhygromyxa sp. WMMC2535 TaxID=2712867 RepID=UPI0015520EC4|nr:hypothetical protein [Pseudenhygromyxa sp. WMMC2535]NVB39448.1 hypothetical protein [Pseudenhygromyxa sp. WMMC2535]
MTGDDATREPPRKAGRLRRLWSWWIALLGREESGESLAAMRILVALTVLIMVVTMVRQDIVGVLYYAPEQGGYLQFSELPWLVQTLGGATPQVVWGLLITTSVAALALGLGIGGRAAALIAGQCLLALRGINSFQGSYGALVGNALWLCVLAPCDLTWSLRARLREGSWVSARTAPCWPRLLGVVQLVILYTWTGLAKISAAWIGDFSALYYILQDPNWQRADMSRAAYVYPLTQVLSALVWVWEASFGLILVSAYFRETTDNAGKKSRLRALFQRVDLRVPYMLFGVATHAAIATLMVVGPFFWATMAFYPCLFSPARWRELLARLPGGRRLTTRT